MSLTATLDKASYSPGETMTLTAVSSPSRTTDFTVTVNNPMFGSANASGQATAPLTVTDTDTAHTWALQSDNGTTAVWTATA